MKLEIISIIECFPQYTLVWLVSSGWDPPLGSLAFICGAPHVTISPGLELWKWDWGDNGLLKQFKHGHIFWPEMNFSNNKNSHLLSALLSINILWAGYYLWNQLYKPFWARPLPTFLVFTSLYIHEDVAGWACLLLLTHNTPIYLTPCVCTITQIWNTSTSHLWLFSSYSVL